MFKNSELLEHIDRLEKFAYRLTRHKERAEDLLHNTIVRALEKKHLFKKGTNLYGWTSKIMYNLFVTEYRRRTKFETQYDPENYLKNYSVDAVQDKKYMLKRVKENITKLSNDHKQIMMLVVFGGMRYKDVSKKLGIPVGTVRSRLARARAALNDNLTGYNAAEAA